MDLPEEGLQLTEPSGLGLSATPPATGMPAPEPQKNSVLSTLGKIGMVIEAGGAGYQGREPLYLRQKQQELQQRKLKLDEVSSRLEIVNNVSKQTQGMAEPERKQFVSSILDQHDDPQLKTMLEQSLSRPDLLSGLSTAVRTDPLVRKLAASGKLDTFISSEAGIKYLGHLNASQYGQEWSKSAPAWIETVKKDQPEIYKQVMADGKISMTELREIVGKLPENLKPSLESQSHFFRSENQKQLSGLLGVPVITDELEHKRQENELTDKGDPEFVKLQSERDRLQAKLMKVTDPKEQQNLQTKISELNNRLQKEQKPSSSSAGREMRDSILLDYMENKRKDPNYQMPDHQRAYLDEYSKTDPLDQIMREVKNNKGSGEKTVKGMTRSAYLKQIIERNPGSKETDPDVQALLKKQGF